MVRATTPAVERLVYVPCGEPVETGRAGLTRLSAYFLKGHRMIREIGIKPPSEIERRLCLAVAPFNPESRATESVLPTRPDREGLIFVLEGGYVRLLVMAQD